MSRSQLEFKMNLENIQKIDPFAKEILHSSSQVAFYVHSEETEWEKTSLEGTFFIYNRTIQPHFSIFVTNRLRSNFVVQLITENMDFQSAPPFLLYRNDEMKRFGLWFSNTLESYKFGEIIKSLIIHNEIPDMTEILGTQDNFSAAKAALSRLPFIKAFDQTDKESSSASSNSSLTDFFISPNLSIDAEIISIDFPEKESILEDFVRPIARVTPSKPVLWLPTKFVSSMQPQDFLDKAEPLSQMQMMEAVSYLIKNDLEFGKKLHEAYLMAREFNPK